MGGMIAQIIAAEYKEREKPCLNYVNERRSEPAAGQAEAMALLAAPLPPPEARQARIEFGVKVYQTIGSPGYQRRKQCCGRR